MSRSQASIDEQSPLEGCEFLPLRNMISAHTHNFKNARFR